MRVIPRLVSVIIPAHDAAATLPDALQSLQAQTEPAWEAIVVDDGSGDGTAGLASRFGDLDRRIRLLRRPHAGVSAARNAGLSAASGEYLLFLDADDWLLPAALAQMVPVLDDPGVDAVHCACQRIGPNGRDLGEIRCDAAGDLFDLLACGPAFAMHACLARRPAVDRAGPFDPALATCEEWDFWQRMARTGARFARLPLVLACYRTHPGSASLDGVRLLRDAFRVSARGHGPDPRVSHPQADHQAGRDPRLLNQVRYRWTCWAAGLVLGAGGDPAALLPPADEAVPLSLDPTDVATNLIRAAALVRGSPTGAWPGWWAEFEPRLKRFLLGLEASSGTPRLARRAQRALEHGVLEEADRLHAVSIGASHVIQLEVTQPMPDLSPPAGIERVHCALTLEGTRLGSVELPVCDGRVPGYLLADAIASRFAWPILGRFFAPRHYAGSPPDSRSTVHDELGWTIFLQELWGRPDWPGARFYEPAPVAEPSRSASVGDRIGVEVSEELLDLETGSPEVVIEVSVGGAAVGAIRLAAPEGKLQAHALRTAITEVLEFELCVAAVREGLVGSTLSGPSSLRERLRDRSSTGPVDPKAVLPRAMILGRRNQGSIGTAASRRAALPSETWPLLEQLARRNREPIYPPASGTAEHLLYAPEVEAWAPRSWPAHARTALSESEAGRLHDRHYFERLFSDQADPWEYSTAYEQVKYRQTLSLLPATRPRRALELACAEGHFTHQLAPRVDRLVAADISQVALSRAAARCADDGNVEFIRLDFVADPLPGTFDLIVCSEVLYYVGDREALERTVGKIAQALEPGGYFITAHASLTVDDPELPGFTWDLPFGGHAIGETIARTTPLRFAAELRTDLYRIQLFRREETGAAEPESLVPDRVITASHGRLAPTAAAGLAGGANRPASRSRRIMTDRLPILLYHRVAAGGAEQLRRYRVSPYQLEEQLAYLRDSGFRGTSLEEWTDAMTRHRALPGRRVLITFDDGLADFGREAWPLLHQYGFSALVFLVSDLVGGVNAWDGPTDQAALLDWDEIGRLQDEGVGFGSHSATHAPLTSLSAVDAVREMAAFRLLLEERLGGPVTALAYPYGDADPVTQHLAGACGYLWGFSCRPALCGLRDPPLWLPRIEVSGFDALPDFIRKLGPVH